MCNDDYRDKKQAAIDKAKKILKKADIQMDIFGCGCCDSPWITMKYKGKTIIDDIGNCNIKMIGKDND